MLSEIPEDEFAAALDACAAEVLWEAGVLEPPVDAHVVAKGLGLVVARDYCMPCRGRYVRLAEQDSHGGGQGTIVVGVAERPEREQWAVAHEIGESVAYRVFERLGVAFEDALPATREVVANRFASALLLPRRWFASDGRDLDWDLIALKDRYDTASHELIARRMLEMRLPIVITICDLGRVHWRKSNVSARPPAMLPEEKAVWQEAHQTGLPAWERLDAECGLESVHCWPIHEPDWKREILRSEVAEW
ncbi:MAG TPA: ImmA/IrrE family metallo-endopeptidase [Lacipirellulaceae bacterium]|nr:ImmA/IrrE family metallo-endopeptidase [Lacipirellulaceae bacterium]